MTSRRSRALVALVALALVAEGVSPALAAPIPFPQKDVTLIGRGELVRDFIADLFGQSGLKVKISTAATGKVNGTFKGTPREIWTQIAKAYHLTAYTSGGLVRIYHDDEVTSRSIASASAAQVAADARRQGLVDGANTVSATANMVVATGVPAFLERIEALAGTMRAPVRTAATTPVALPTIPVDPAAGMGLATPLLAGTQPMLRANMARGAVRSQIVAAAGKRSPFEVRMFFLKYRDAADKEQRSTDRITVIPGVATLLREQMGDGLGGVTVASNAANQFDNSEINRVGNRRSPSDGGRYDRDNRGEDQGAPEVVQAAAGDLNGPRITADSTNNSVIVRDRPEVMPIYEQLIANFDIEPVMIETEVTILEVSTNKLSDLGVDFSLGIGGLRAVFGGNFQTPGNTGNISAGYLSGNGDSFFARIRALEQSGALRVVSRPVLSTPSNQVAVFDNRTQQFARLQGEREVALYPISYGLSMRVRPSAIEDGGELRIRMDIEIEDTSLNGNVVDGIPVPSGPRVSTQSIDRHGESVMLAGMTSSTEYDFKSKTPVLGDVPLIGQVFRKRRKGKDRVERLFLLTPRIASANGSPSRVQAMAQQAPLLPIEALTGKRPKKRTR